MHVLRTVHALYVRCNVHCTCTPYTVRACVLLSPRKAVPRARLLQLLKEKYPTLTLADGGSRARVEKCLPSTRGEKWPPPTQGVPPSNTHPPATPLANSTAAPVYLTRVVAGKCRGRHTEAARLRPSADRHAGRPGDAARDLLQQSDGAAAGAVCSKPEGPSLRQPMHPTPLSEARPPARGCPNCPRLGGEHLPLGTPKKGFGRVLWECLLARGCADSNTWPFRLGLKLRDPERSLLDMAEAMLALGAVVPSGGWQPRDEL